MMYHTDVLLSASQARAVGGCSASASFLSRPLPEQPLPEPPLGVFFLVIARTMATIVLMR
jgi:hypothetical protein